MAESQGLVASRLNTFYVTILKSSHPLMLLLHLIGKAAPIVFYLIGSFFLNFTAQFILVVLLLAFDFYFTKNISGRKLVQLRWWYDPSTKTTETFTFESYKQYAPGPPINSIDAKLFWWSTYLVPVIWMVFGIFCILGFKIFYLLLVMVAAVLTGMNAYGFRNCDKWDPNPNSNQTDSWFQMPTIPNIENLTRLATIQSFFQNRS
ncbi:hypothetical protein HG535_0B02850 [Zygotorulaspora mrakii]|uniref:Golgi apparatus membrane protein TVP23 n=1 Tax=Zygotorulaspora mrakii TaxID=42260 RepID=A0A7H9AYB7_ZYGMR|nr:uncharacterized protein HG535_0B02850 [Zygotorulaspora mrakii]QLG71246.1 hypothetical protein HG535_0B02850 [Zygotorulaspora mrakii]